jgi:hypothetical protein
MSTDLSSELLAYHAFVRSTLSKGGSIDNDATPQAFLEYQRQLAELRGAIRPSMERFKKGEPAEELDIERFVETILQKPEEPGCN